MDKSWIDIRDRNSQAYLDWVESFLDFAFKDTDIETSEIYCPCMDCLSRYYHDLQTVKDHIEMRGFDQNYKCWIRHVEPFGGFPNNTNNGYNMSNEDIGVETIFGVNIPVILRQGLGIPEVVENMENDKKPNFEDVVDEEKFYRRLKEAESELYENFPEGVSELSFVVELLHLKQLNRWSNHSFTMLLDCLKRIFPIAKIPKSRDDKLPSDLDFKYETWDVCLNSCMIFRDDTAKLEKCDICKAFRYKNVSTPSQRLHG